MKKISLYLFLVVFCGVIASCSSDDDGPGGDGGTEIVLQDTVFYVGSFIPSIISYNEGGEEYSIHAYEGQVIVYFKDGVTYQKSAEEIKKLEGEIIEQVPNIEYFLVKVAPGKEYQFISDLNKSIVEYATLNIIELPLSINSEVYIPDNYSTVRWDKEDRIKHGIEVESAYKQCGCEFNYKNRIEIAIKDDIINAQVDRQKALNEMLKRKGNSLYNFSFGPALNNNPNLKWKDRGVHGPSYVEAEQIRIKNILTYLAKCEKEGIKGNIITIAAGNCGMPDFDKLVLYPMLNYTAGKNNLTQKEKELLDKNILIVTSTEEGTNKSNPHYAMGNVDITGIKYNNKQLTGSSFAAPKALCTIKKVMKDQNISAVEALGIVKKSIALNGGVLIDDVNKIINPNFGRPTVLANTTWKINNELTIFFNANGKCSLVTTLECNVRITGTGEWTLSGNEVNFNLNFHHARHPDGTGSYCCEVDSKWKCKGPINGNTINGNLIIIDQFSGEGCPTTPIDYGSVSIKLTKLN